MCLQDEKDEWRRFQADLQTAVVVANDIKVEAQQELRNLQRQLQEEQDRNTKLSADLEALQGVRYVFNQTNLVLSTLSLEFSFVWQWAAVLFCFKNNLEVSYLLESSHIPIQLLFFFENKL